MALAAPSGAFELLCEFYATTLALPVAAVAGAEIRIEVGESTLSFAPAGSDAFYHFALLIPDGRFEAAQEWLAANARLLAEPAGSGTTFEFAEWRARASYFHDPAHNIVELIALAGIGGQASRRASFDPREILGVSEFGLVSDDPPMVARRLARLGVEQWNGALAPGRLAFFGERGRTLIVSPTGRGWLPTGQPARPFPARLRLRGCRSGSVTVGPYVIDAASD